MAKISLGTEENGVNAKPKEVLKKEMYTFKKNIIWKKYAKQK